MIYVLNSINNGNDESTDPSFGNYLSVTDLNLYQYLIRATVVYQCSKVHRLREHKSELQTKN